MKRFIGDASSSINPMCAC